MQKRRELSATVPDTKMDRRRELFALAVVVVVLAVFPGALLAYRSARASAGGLRTIDITASVPESGGFRPDAVRLVRGERVRLRLSAPDVVHGFEIPGLGVSAPDIYPGHVVEVTFTPQETGRFTFACTRWCGTSHWRMRGIVEVVDPAPTYALPGSGGGGSPALAGPAAAPAPAHEPPLYQRLRIDLDAMVEIDPGVEESLARLPGRPSAARGLALAAALPADLRDPAWLKAHTPGDAYRLVRGDAQTAASSDAQAWDLVAFAWQNTASDVMLARAAALYARDCAACHGEQGRGDGALGRDAPGLARMDPELKRGPADFTDARRMASLADAYLQGKILRGGMGTGMPPFGPLLSTDDQWALVALIRTFTLERAGPIGGP